jgi:ABC-type uncharacterized transport system fused permease/ATPase subunit
MVHSATDFAHCFCNLPPHPLRLPPNLAHPLSRHLTNKLALGWRRRLTEALSGLYFKNLAFYKASHLVESLPDADQRLVSDVDKLCQDLAGLVTSMVKPVVDILWFTWRMHTLTGRTGVGLL